MKRFDKFRKVFTVLLLTITPVVSSLVAMPARPVLAAACNYDPGGGAGGAALVSLSSSFGAVDSTVEKLGAEFTPSQAWSSEWSAYINQISFAKSGCENANASVNFAIEGNSLRIYTYNQVHSGPYVADTDYSNLGSGVAISENSTDQSASFTYTMPTISENTAQLLSVDIGSNSGWADIYLKQGGNTENRLVSIKLPAGVVSFLNKYNKAGSFVVGNPAFYGNTCSGVTGSGGALVRALADGSPIEQTVYDGGFDQCVSFNKSSYNSTTKTANLNYQTAGITPDHIITSGGQSVNTVGGDFVGPYSTLQTSESEEGVVYMSNYLRSSTNTSQQVYLVAQSSQSGGQIPTNTPYPIAGAQFDFSASDVDIAGVKLDVSQQTYASLAHGLGAKTVNNTFSLFAPQREGDQYVGVCPGADSIGSVNTTCSNLYFLEDGETKNGAAASIVTVGALKFWKVDGLTGTGVFSSTVGQIPGSPNSGVSGGGKNIALGVIICGGLVLALKLRKQVRVRA